jgi:hypothetical protein
MAETLATNAWLVWREGKEGRPEFHGLMKSEEAAAQKRSSCFRNCYRMRACAHGTWNASRLSVGASLWRAAECLVAGR